MAHLNNNVYLNMDLSAIKNDINLLKHKTKNQDDLVNSLNSFISDSKRIISSVNNNITTQVESKTKLFNTMLIDTISELQLLKQQVDKLEKMFKTIDSKIDVFNHRKTEIQTNNLEESKSVIDFLETMDLKDKYLDTVIKLGCKDKGDLLFFKEDELVNNGFLLLHARKILSNLQTESQN